MGHPADIEELDVLVIGAGLSGVGAGRYLRTEHPFKSFAILESRGASGGTWDLFRYPGLRSDSDLNTFGYEFKPWLHEESIADGGQILAYIRETITENRLEPYIRYHHRVVHASWSSGDARWLVEAEHTPQGAEEPITKVFSARWIFSAVGYYRYDEGHTPVFKGRDRFPGEIVHPQHWPENLDYSGKKVIIIGSGATAVTLLPALLEGPGAAAHATMLQRTPTYVMPLPRKDPIALGLRKAFGDERGYALTRRKNIALQNWMWNLSQKRPERLRQIIRKANIKALPEGYDVDTHFNPPYSPWEQRLCAVPDGDLFKVIREGRADVVTDHIDTFTENGILLASGTELEADIIVTATGLALQFLGGIELALDGEPVSAADRIAYRGMMLSGVPNFAFAVGYTNSSWTLKIGLLCEYFCRLLTHMDIHRYDVAVAEPDPGMTTRPLLDFAAGYVKRALDHLPKQGAYTPWLMSMNFHDDRRLLRSGEVADRYLRFTRSGPQEEEPKADHYATLPSGIRLCHRTDGDPNGEPLLLVSGLSEDLTAWPRRFVDGLVEQGFFVIRFDNRDVGRSSVIDAPPPSRMRRLAARPRPDAYTLEDMAADAAALMTHLGIQRFHVVGKSMGGMIAQALTAGYRDRVITLTSIYSTTGDPKVGQPTMATKLKLTGRPPHDLEEGIRLHLDMVGHLAGRDHPYDEAEEIALASGAWARAHGAGAAGVARQIQAIQASGDRTSRLRDIIAPTLVIHGDRDPIVDPTGGRATAEAIPGARYVVIPGMGHHLAPGLVDELVSQISGHCRKEGKA